MPGMQQFSADGALLQYTISVFGNLRQDDRAKKEEHNDRIVAKKRLVAPAYLKEINAFQGVASKSIRRQAFNFPLKGVYFVPRGLLKAVHDRLVEIQVEFNDKVAEFLSRYESEYLPEARESLGELYREDDYPTLEEMRTKFGFKWQYMSLGSPDSLRADFPELYEEHHERLQEMMTNFEDEAANALRSGFADLVSRLTHATAPKNGGAKRPQITDSLFRDWTQFIRDFKHLNITNDVELAEMTKKAEEIVKTCNADRLRGSQRMRDRVHASMDVINRDVQDRLITGRRKIHMDLED